jgi:hypothetical protein
MSLVTSRSNPAYTHGFDHLLGPDRHGHGGTSSRGETVGLDVGLGALDGECTGQSRDSSFGGRVVGLTNGTVCDGQLQSGPAGVDSLHIPLGEQVVMIRPYFCFWK